MKLAFYSVDNSLGYDRHTFEYFSDQPQVIEDMLQPLLDKDEAAITNVEDEESLVFFQEEFNDEVYDGWWCIMIPDQEEQKETLESMISAHAYDEIVSRVKDEVGVEAFDYIFPGVKKALEEGPGKVRDKILSRWLDCSSMRVCTHCGKIMEKGWYLDNSYACSDECCMALTNIGKEEFDKYGIYKYDIEEYLKDEGKGRTIEKLTKEEIDEITNEIVDSSDTYYYTEWD